MKIQHISVSRKSTFEECEKKYHFQYELEKKPTDPEPFHFTYGKIVHRIAEEYVRREGESPIGALAKKVLSGEIEIEEGQKAPPLPPDYAKKLPVHLRHVQHFTERAGFGGVVEHDFRYDLDPPNGRFVKGKIDRIINKDDKYWIIDYKTTKKGWWRKGPQEVRKDLQLRIYARVVQKEFGASPENIKAALYYLEDGELCGASFSEASLVAAEKELLETYLKIEAKDPSQVWGSVGRWCQSCPWRKCCPFYSLT